MTTVKDSLSSAQADRQLRLDRDLDGRVGSMLDELGLTDERIVELANADRVGSDARKKLAGLMKHYAKKPHPFTSCVRDNTKRFGKARAEKVCARLKDLIRGTTKWRGKGKEKLSDEPISCPMLEIDDDVVTLLEEIDPTRLAELVAEEVPVAST